MAIKNYQIVTAGYTYFPGPTSAGIPAGETWAITTILICNNDTSDHIFDMYIVKNGGTETVTLNRMINQQTIQAQDTFIMDTEKLVLEAGDRLSFQQSGGTAALNLIVSYLVV